LTIYKNYEIKINKLVLVFHSNPVLEGAMCMGCGKVPVFGRQGDQFGPLAAFYLSGEAEKTGFDQHSRIGLPVTHDVLLIPAGLPPDPGNVVYRLDGLHCIFHGDTLSPSGQYRGVPLPPAAVWLGSGLAILLGYGRRRRSRKS
jgi:hypothetical protein